MLIHRRHVTIALLLIFGFTLTCNGVVAWLDSKARGAQCRAFKRTLIGRDRYSITHPIPGTQAQIAARKQFNEKDIVRIEAQTCG